METLLRKGNIAEIYFNDETKKYVIKSAISEVEYIYVLQKRALDCWKDLEKKYKIIKK